MGEIIDDNAVNSNKKGLYYKVEAINDMKVNVTDIQANNIYNKTENVNNIKRENYSPVNDANSVIKDIKDNDNIKETDKGERIINVCKNYNDIQVTANRTIVKNSINNANNKEKDDFTIKVSVSDSNNFI